MKNTNVIILSLIVSFMILLGFFFKQLEETKEAYKLAEGMEDELIISENRIKQEKARSAVLRTQNLKDFLRIKTKEGEVKELQKLVKEYKGKINTAVVLKNTTGSKGVEKTIYKTDTVVIEGESKIRPVYTAKWANKWEEGSIIAREDSIYRDIKIKNEYNITVGDYKNGLFKKKQYEVQVLNLNPNTKTKELETYQLKTTDKKISIGAQIGYGLGLKNMTFQPYIGLGINFNLIGVK